MNAPAPPRTSKRLQRLLINSGTLLVLFGIGCSPLSPPDVEQVTRDLVGQSFKNPGGWTRIEVVSVQKLEIKQRSTDKEAKTDEIHAVVTATNKNNLLGPDKFEGLLVIRYKHFEQGWRIQSVEGSR